jgi:eukaryotic-like serine/threonine-protein kinase
MNDEELFHLALEKPTGKRSDFLDRACAGDVSRRRRVEALLRSHDTPDSFLVGRAGDPGALSAATPAGLGLRRLLRDALDEDAGVSCPFLPVEAGRVLETLAATVGPIARVLLTETQGHEDGDPVIQPSSPEMPSPADRTGRVTLLGEIARGGMGAVLKGRDPDLGRDLAVKVLLEMHRDKPELVRRFIEEAQIAGQLQHPGIVPVYELGAFGDARPYFTMKLVRGSTLAQLLVDRPTPEAELTRFLGIIEQVCQTVAYAHARGVIHRDLKPSNVMVGSFGEVQVMDWGLAKVLPRGGAADDASAGRHEARVQETIIATSRAESDLSRAGSILGTPSYMAPEQARGEVQSLDERCDVFALGSILCEILTGSPAFRGEAYGEIQRKAALGDLADATGRLAGCGADAELAGLARDCLAADPDDRPGAAAAVAERLTAYQAGVQGRLRTAELAQAAESARAEEATRTALAAHARARAERRARRLTAALAAAVVGLVALGGGGGAWLEHQRVARSTATARFVHDALAEALRLEGEARSSAADDPTRWDGALAEARRADGLLRHGEADAALSGRVATVLSSLKRSRDAAARRAEQTRVDRELLAALSQAHSKHHGLDYLQKTDRAYVAAFLAVGLDVDRSEAKAVGEWVAGRPTPVELAAFIDDWAHIRRWTGAGDGRRPWTHLIAVAQVADPDPWRNTLRAGLAGDVSALRALADDERDLAGRSVVSLNLLGIYLKDVAGDPDRAERVFRLAWFRSPDDFWTNLHIVEALDGKRPTSSAMLIRWRDERLRFLTATVALRPDRMFTFSYLGDNLRDDGRLDEAIAAYREEIRRHADNAYARNRLASAMLDRGEVETGLAMLRDESRRGGAIEYWNLGKVLESLRKHEEALTAYREAVRLDGTHIGSAILNLGALLRRLGRYDEAAETYRRARTLAEADGQPAEATKAEQGLEFVAIQRALYDRLPDLLRGVDRPKDRTELYQITCLCNDRRLYATGARACDAAFRADPSLADDPELRNRYNAACLAALAGSGRGSGEPQPDEAERCRLRARALSWLQAQLAAWSKRLEAATLEGRKVALKRLDEFRTDPDLADIRLPIALADLPAPEQEAWRTFWGEVDALVAKSRGDHP